MSIMFRFLCTDTRDHLSRNRMVHLNYPMLDDSSDSCLGIAGRIGKHIQ